MKIIRWKFPDAQLTLLPERGRVLQVTVDGQEAFWTNPNWSGDWNAGGDRLWVAPETAWFWQTRGPVDWSRYAIPATVDPGRWKLVDHAKHCCRVTQRARLRHQTQRAEVDVELSRCFSVVELPVAPFFQSWVAYRTDNELRIRGGTRGQRVGLWSLLQLPAGGRLEFSCRATPAFRVYTGDVPRHYWSHTDRQLTCRITGKHAFKFGLAPELVSGRMAYARPVRGGWLVIYREFHPQPWREYCDRPLTASGDRGDAVQVYNDGGEFGGFGEMEFHSPALEVGRGNDWLQDSCFTVVGFVAARQWGRWSECWLRSGGE